MAKQTPRIVLDILRQFNIAGELSVPKEVTHIHEFEPRTGVHAYRCIFAHTQYYILMDANADDNTETLKEYIAHDKADVHGHFVKNPHEDAFATFGVRYKFKDMYLFRVAANKRRIDIELASRYPELSRSTLQKYVKAGYVTVNGQVIDKTKVDVSDIDDISVQPPSKTDFSSEELPIVYIDDSIIVVNKPSGVLTHSKGIMNDEFTVADFFRRYTTNALHTTRPGIVHRLDRDTSGIIIGARTDEAAVMLKKQFASRTTHKQYLAVIEGVPSLPQARIDLPIGRNPSAPSTFRVDPSGKAAITTYEVLASNEKQSLVLLKPQTGRTHQLRVHMQYINAPIVGDKVYGKAKDGQRLMLHARDLEITIPPSQRRTFSAPAPDEFTQLFKEAANV